MSEEKQSPKSPFFDENLNPKNEGSENTEVQQDEESIYSMDVENANLHIFDVLSSNNPTCDIALSQLSLQLIENPTSTPKSEGDQIAALESTSDQMAQLKKAAEGIFVPEIDPKGDSESAANPKGDSEIDMDQIAASESENLSVASGSLSQVSLWDEASLALPEPPRIDIINGLVREHFPALFAEGNRLRDIFGITNVPDNILIELQHKCLFILYQNRVHREGDNVDILLSGALIMELKHLYALGLIRDLVMEGDITNFATLYPAAGQEDKMVCAALILGFTLLAFADYTQTGRERRLKELIEKCRATGVPLPHEHQAQPEHPLTNWLQCVSASYNELKLYVQALKDAINCFSANNIESIENGLRYLIEQDEIHDRQHEQPIDLHEQPNDHHDHLNDHHDPPNDQHDIVHSQDIVHIYDYDIDYIYDPDTDLIYDHDFDYPYDYDIDHGHGDDQCHGLPLDYDINHGHEVDQYHGHEDDQCHGHEDVQCHGHSPDHSHGHRDDHE